MLHIISRSLFESRSASTSTRLMSSEDAVILLGDGLYSANHPEIAAMPQVYAIEEDRSTRGLRPQNGIKYIDYTTMVTLTVEHNPVVTWS